MGVINGTPGNDDFFLSATQDDEVFAGAGNDRFVINDSFGVGKLRVDGGDGDDLFLIKDGSSGPTIIHGGAGNDTFRLFYGGTVYGDAGADIFRLTDDSGQLPFRIADFSADDVLDILPHFEYLSFPAGPDPFATGYARFMQLGPDAMLQFKNGSNGEWRTFGYILGRDATQFTTAQLGGMKTVVVPFPASVSISTAATSIMEGGTVTVDVALSEPSTEAVLVWATITRLSDGNIASRPVYVTLQPGETKGQIVVAMEEEGYLDTLGQVAISASAFGYASNPLNPSRIVLPFIDNDQKGFSVAYGNPTYAYKNLTLLDAVRPGDAAALSVVPSGTWPPPGREYVRLIEPFVLSTTSVALTAYQFFTGKSPGLPGLKFLVNSPDNASDLNDAAGIYTAMNTENRYINFAANLGLVGEGKAAFAAAYGGLTFRQAVDKAYDAIIGKAYAQAAGIDVTAAINGVVAAKTYFDAVAYERMGGFDHELAVKAGMIGYLIAEGQKAHVGVYARAVENFYLDFMDSTAQHNVDLVAVYGPGTFLDAM